MSPLLAASSVDYVVPLVTVLAALGAIISAVRPRAAATRLSRAPVLETPSHLGSEPRQTRWLEQSLLFILAGYILFDRPFAWLHVPGTPLFVGEMVLALGVAVVFTTRTRLAQLLRRSASLKAVRNLMIWGAILLVLQVLPYGLDAIRDSALWYYGFVAMLVVILFWSRPERVNEWTGRFARLLPVYLAWFPFAVVLASVGPNNILVPDSRVSIFNHKSGNMAVLTGIAIAFLWLADSDNRYFSRRQRIWLTTLATLLIVLTGLQNRGGMVATSVMIAALLLVLSKRRGELLMLMIAAVVLTASIAVVFDIRIELFGDREISVEQFTNNISSIIDPEAGGQRQSSTTAWRLNIWEQVLNDVTNDHPFMGFGPGPDLGERYDISTDPNVPLRNPHNSHVGILARLGWVGVTLWLLLWATWFTEMYQLRRRLRQKGDDHMSNLVGWIFLIPIPILVNAIFDPTLEGAQVAVMLWAFVGSGAAIALLERTNRLPESRVVFPSRAKSSTASPRVPIQN